MSLNTSESLPGRMIDGVAPIALASLGNRGEYFTPNIPVRVESDEFRSSPIIDALRTPFSVDEFNIARAPISLGMHESPGFSEPFSVSDMLIKEPGSSCRVPLELAGINAILSTCLAAERIINSNYDEYYAYLTVQYSETTIGQAKRGHGAHSDSIQGPRISPKVVPEHGYVFADKDPTKFYVQPFDLRGLDPDKDWLVTKLKDQANEANAIRLAVGELALFDAYTIHSGVESEKEGMRTFFRLLFSVRQFDRLGNTINPSFDYRGWNFQPRPIPTTLRGMPKKLVSQ